MNKEVKKVVQEQMPGHPDKKTMWFLVGIPLIAILVLGAFVGGMLWASSQSGSDLVVDDADDTEVVDEDEEEDDEIEFTYGDIDGELSISWYTESQRHEVALFADYSEYLYSPEDPEDFALAVGIVEGGEYDGYELVLNMFQEEGMGTGNAYFYTLVDSDDEVDIVVLDQYYSYVGSAFTRPGEYSSTIEWLEREPELLASVQDDVVINLNLVVPELEWDRTITSTGGAEFITLGVWQSTYVGYGFDDHDIVGYTTGPGRPIYEIPEGNNMAYSLLVEREDSRLMVYLIDIPFHEPESLYSSAQPDMVWNNGDAVATYVSTKSGGCGVEQFTHVVSSFEMPELTRKTGSTAHGEDVTEPLPPDSYYDDLYDTWLSWNEGGTRDEFIALHPIFFWEDALGRWIQFSNVDAIPPGECGKPVIYLYPEETTHMVVEVDPQGGFTYTEPDYGDGWEVIAYPDGYVKNIADNQIYPYLFWEGRGGLYSEPETYWVVPQEEVEPFLIKTLARFGFEGREIWEFMEFWAPRMQEAEYYKIGFHGTEVMDAIAPLTLSQQPDHVLRILMDFTELDAPEPSNPPAFIPSFERSGFYVTEWGGVIR